MIQEINSVVDRIIGEGHALGVVNWAAMDGRIVVDAAWGSGVDRNGGIFQLTPNTGFDWWCCSKALTATAIAVCVDRGELAWTATLGELLGPAVDESMESVSIEDLLRHTAPVVQDPPLEMIPASTWEEVVSEVKQCRLRDGWPVGKETSYSLWVSWIYLGMALQMVTGQTPDVVVKKEVLSRLAGTESCQCTLIPSDFRGTVTESIEWYGHDEKFVIQDLFVGPGVDGRILPGFSCRGELRVLGLLADDLRKCRVGGTGLMSEKTAEEFLAAPDRSGSAADGGDAWGRGLSATGRWFSPRLSERAFGHKGMHSVTFFSDPEIGLTLAIAFVGMVPGILHSARESALIDLYVSLANGEQVRNPVLRRFHRRVRTHQVTSHAQRIDPEPERISKADLLRLACDKSAPGFEEAWIANLVSESAMADVVPGASGDVIVAIEDDVTTRAELHIVFKDGRVVAGGRSTRADSLSPLKVAVSSEDVALLQGKGGSFNTAMREGKVRITGSTLAARRLWPILKNASFIASIFDSSGLGDPTTSNHQYQP